MQQARPKFRDSCSWSLRLLFTSVTSLSARAGCLVASPARLPACQPLNLPACPLTSSPLPASPPHLHGATLSFLSVAWPPCLPLLWLQPRPPLRPLPPLFLPLLPLFLHLHLPCLSDAAGSWRNNIGVRATFPAVSEAYLKIVIHCRSTSGETFSCARGDCVSILPCR